MKRLRLVNDNFVYQGSQPLRLPAIPLFFFNRPFFPTRYFLTLLVAFCCSVFTYAQTSVAQQQTDYKKTITERASKIVNTLGITDSTNYKRTVSEIADQYFSLNTIQEQHKASLDAIKMQSLVKEDAAAAVKQQEEKRMSQLLQLHQRFITLLKKHLTDTQVDQVKDGMTYRVFPITYTAYLDMVPTLTNEQKTQIYDWLKEAREVAMDAESSEKKHAVFGKYKGRINNYLSKAGYDMKKEGEEWQKRIKEREEKKAQ